MKQKGSDDATLHGPSGGRYDSDFVGLSGSGVFDGSGGGSGDIVVENGGLLMVVVVT